MTAPLATGQQANEYYCYYSLFTSNTYPSKPKIDDVGSAKYYEKGKIQSTFLVYMTVIERGKGKVKAHTSQKPDKPKRPELIPVSLA